MEKGYYGRRGGDSSGRGQGGGGGGGGGGRRGNSQYFQNQGGSRGRQAPNRVFHHQAPTPQEWPNRDNQTSDQHAWGYRPPHVRQSQQQYQPVVGAVGGRAGAWRPLAPSPSTPLPQVQTIPSPQFPARPSAEELSIQNLKISNQKPLSSLTEGKENQIEAIRRPDGGGTLAIRKIRLLVNHFPVTYDVRRTILHYDVEIKPVSTDTRVVQRKLSRSDMRLIRDNLFSHDPQFRGLEIAYDGEKNIFSPVPLPTGSFTVNISEGEEVRSGSYTFIITLVNELKLSKLEEYMRGNLSYIPRDILQGMDLVMKENPSRERIRVGSSFYPKENLGGYNLGYGLSAYRGIRQSLKPTSQGLSLCLDYSVLAFRKPLPVIEYIKEYIPGFTINDVVRLKREVEEALKGLRVRVTHRRTKQKYIIAGLTKENACDVYFYDSDPENQNPPRKIFLVNYFKDKWDKDIVHKNIPCLELGTKNKSNKVPMEFCVLVEGQRYPKEDLDRDTGVILKNLSLAKPSTRKDTINNMVKSADGPCGGAVVKEFGISVDTDMTKVVGRVLGAPQLKLRGSIVPVDREKCQWNLLGGKTLMNGIAVERWGLLEFVDRRDNGRRGEEFVYNLMNRCESLGMKMKDPLYIDFAQMNDLSSVDALVKVLQGFIKTCGGKLQLIVCGMTKRHSGYKNLKWIAETRLGVVTQCYLSPSAASKKGQDQYFANLCLKINAKLGGNNFELSGTLPLLEQEDHVMFIGADVNHPAPLNKSCPSIAAVVGSINWPAANRYAARVLPQTHRCEEIINFGTACWDLVSTYAGCNAGSYPKRILIFRDGLSEGQFEMALCKELSDLRRIFADQGYEPKITFIVTIKRHQTRLFVQDERDGGRSGNVPPGTVVDTNIVHPLDFDFYLCSHYGGLGTSKPTHYYVLWDENHFSSDQLQKLTYDMCFTFARCTKPVSLVPPVYYADLAAYRGRMFQEAAMESQSSARFTSRASSIASSSSSFSAASFDESSYQMHPDLKNHMFFI